MEIIKIYINQIPIIFFLTLKVKFYLKKSRPFSEIYKGVFEISCTLIQNKNPYK